MLLAKCPVVCDDKEKELEEKIDALRYNFLISEVNVRTRFFREKGKTKCHGCRINKAKMPHPPVDVGDVDLLQCGCKIQEALVEEVYVKLGLIGEDIAKEREGENGWKAISRPERERILKTLDLLGLDLSSLVELFQD